MQKSLTCLLSFPLPTLKSLGACRRVSRCKSEMKSSPPRGQTPLVEQPFPPSSPDASRDAFLIMKFHLREGLLKGRHTRGKVGCVSHAADGVR